MLKLKQVLTSLCNMFEEPKVNISGLNLEYLE